MKIEIKPTSLLNLEHICEVLYKLHPNVLGFLVNMQRGIGDILGLVELSNTLLEEREKLSSILKPKDPEDPPNYKEKVLTGYQVNDIIENARSKYASDYLADGTPVFKEKGNFVGDQPTSIESLQKQLEKEKAYRREQRFHELRKYIQLDTYEYIPMKIFVEIEDPVVGRKVKELVEALEKTGAPEQFYLNKKEIDEVAYFAEGYGLTMNKEQKMKFKKFFWTADADALRNLLIKEKLY